jgi:CheY-like chemotaxis protein
MNQKMLSKPVRSRKRVLIVDDDAGVRSLLKEVLESAGYDVLEAIDGKQAIAAKDGPPIDLIVTDLAMPEADGIEVIRAFGKTQPVPAIIVLSGAFNGCVLKAARLLGAKATLPKPIDIDQLTALVNDLAG